MKKTILSLLVAAGLIGSCFGSVITVSDVTKGYSNSFDSQYFNQTALNLDFGVSSGDSMSISWIYNSAPTPPSYATTDGSYNNTTSFSGLGGGGYATLYKLVSTFNVNADSINLHDGFLGYEYPLTLQTAFIAQSNLLSVNLINNFSQLNQASGLFYEYVNAFPYGYYGRFWNQSNRQYNWTDSVSIVPEPSTYALFGIGAIGLLMVMRRKKTA